MKQLIRGSLIFSVIGALVGGGTMVGQSRDDLARKYGAPIAETFMVRSDVDVTATCARNGQIKELLISPQQSGYIKSRAKTLSTNDVKAIIDELVPNPTRGRFLTGTFIDMDCLPENDCHGSSEDYDKLTIYYNSASEGQIHYAVVQWKE